MYIAELKGKLSLNNERSEDLLTSNVFSFFKYSDRSVYLKRLLSLVGIDATEKELLKAEFIFWPNYEDGTEPDLVLIVGKYYLLFEAKYFYDFGYDTVLNKGQLEREIESGLNEAQNRGLQFRLVTITADYCYPRDKLKVLPRKYRNLFVWINWQAVSRVLLDVLEKYKEESPDCLIAEDLYNLLLKKNLRGFLPFSRLEKIFKLKKIDKIFFSAEETSFRGHFIGFQRILSDHPEIHLVSRKIFYSKDYFSNFPCIKRLERNKIFFQERKNV